MQNTGNSAVFWLWLGSRYKLPESFTTAQSHQTFKGLPRYHGYALYVTGIMAYFTYYKNEVVFVRPGAAREPIRVKPTP